MQHSVPYIPNRSAYSLRRIETGIGQQPVLETEHDHQSQSNQKRGYGVEDNQGRRGQPVGEAAFFVSAPKPPQKPDASREQHCRNRNLQRIADFFADERRNSCILFIRISERPVQKRPQVIAKLHRKRFVQMQRILVKCHLRGRHVLLGKACQVRHRVAGQQPRQEKIQNHDQQKAHERKPHIFSVILHARTSFSRWSSSNA